MGWWRFVAPILGTGISGRWQRNNATVSAANANYRRSQPMTAEATPVLRVRNDAAMRKRLFVAEAMAHPAKGNIFMWQECIERYSKEGDTVLDPMAGIGTTLIAALMGRNVICVEKETHFVEPMRRSWEKMRQHPMLGYELGQVEIHQGDARDLSAILGLEHPVLEQNPDLAADVILSSPPYEGSIQGDTSEATRKRIAEGKYHGLNSFVWPTNWSGN